MRTPVIQGLAALAAVGLPMALAWFRARPRRARPGEAPAELGPFPRVLFFSSSTCPTCPPAREVVVNAAGDAVREVAWPKDTIAFHKLGVGVVPVTMAVDGRGRVVEVFEGLPDRRRLRRAVAKAGIPGVLRASDT